MANWYVSSVSYTAVAQWAATTPYSVGALVRQLATPAVGSERVFRCTTAGTSLSTEPATWQLAHGATTTESGGPVWTEVTGNATYNWTAPHARIGNCVTNGSTWAAAGDTVFASSDHAETQAAALSITAPASGAGVSVISVNKAGSVPPVAADILVGAKVTTTGANGLTLNNDMYYEGVAFSCATGASAASLSIDSNSSPSHIYFKNCAFAIGHTAAGGWLSLSGSQEQIVWDNCTVQFGAVGQSIAVNGDGLFEWRNTPSAVAGSFIPTNLFGLSGRQIMRLRGLDLSAMGSGKTLIVNSAATLQVVTVEDCKLGASVTTVSVSSNSVSSNGNSIFVDLINCDSGATGYRNEFYRRGGYGLTETTITRASGASDGIQTISWKTLSLTSGLTFAGPFELPPIAQWNALTGSARTATIEIISSASLNNDDIWLELEYLGSSASPLGSIVTSLPATRLTTNAALPTSSKTWNASPATPVKQYLQATFTPQMAGLVVARVKIAKASATIYVDPLLTIV